MKTFITRVTGNSFRTAIASTVLAAVLFVSQAASAQNITPADNSSISSQPSNGFQAAIHPIYNSLKMKVHVLNPDEETVTVLIQDADKKEVFRKKIGTKAVIHGSFNVSDMPNGFYTITVRSATHTFSRSFVIEPQQERIAKAL